MRLKNIAAKIPYLKPVLKSVLALTLVFTLVLGNAQGALAARTGGRIGGGSFRAPSRTYTAPSSGYRQPGGYYPGGGFGFPFLFPLFGFGGGFGGLFSILIFIAIANFLVRSFRNASSGESVDGYGYENPSVSVAKVQVGLLAQARDLQAELNELALSADTNSSVGQAQVLQEATLALLRHPEYWVYGDAEAQSTPLALAEAKFNQLALAERSKFTQETLSNYNNQLRQAEPQAALTGDEGNELLKPSGEYLVATIVAGFQGDVKLPKINSTEDLSKALRQIGSMSSDRLLGVEVLWTPQAEGDTLSTDDIIANYPQLKLV
jgi:uncharacterized membrane protein